MVFKAQWYELRLNIFSIIYFTPFFQLATYPIFSHCQRRSSHRAPVHRCNGQDMHIDKKNCMFHFICHLWLMRMNQFRCHFGWNHALITGFWNLWEFHGIFFSVNVHGHDVWNCLWNKRYWFDLNMNIDSCFSSKVIHSTNISSRLHPNEQMTNPFVRQRFVIFFSSKVKW